jgi:AraC-like DNA-binding protein
MDSASYRPARDSGAAPGRRPIAGIGRVLLRDGFSLWIGRDAGRMQAHAHHAIQISLALGGRFLIRGDAGGWAEHTGAIVLPHRRHQFDGCGASLAHLFVEPETVQGRALLERHGESDIGALDDATAARLAAALREGYAAEAPDEVLLAAGLRSVAVLAGPAPPARSVDPRVGRAIELMRSRLDASISLAQAAAAAHLSPSRFRHLFVAQTGVSFRAYLLWARVNAAMSAGMGGQSWTEAAQAAGFADSAHLSRTCRRMFGIAPAMLLRE